MSEAFIKADKKLPASVKVALLSTLTGIDRDGVLGRLWRFWSWVDDHIKRDGALRLSAEQLSQTVMVELCLLDAMSDQRVDWLRVAADGSTIIPRTDKWFLGGQRHRSKSAQRQKAYRDRRAKVKTTRAAEPEASPSSNGDAQRVTSRVTSRVAQRAALRNGTEERREEKRREEGTTSTSDPDLASDVAPDTAAERRKGAKTRKAHQVATDAVRALAIRVDDKLRVPKPICDEDRSVVLKTAWLVEVGLISEHELWASIESVTKKFDSPGRRGPRQGKRMGYWHATLTGMLGERETPASFNAMLKTVTLPVDLFKPTQPHAAKPVAAAC